MTIPVSFEFYEPEEGISACVKANKKLEKEGFPKKYRPKGPAASESYCSKK